MLWVGDGCLGGEMVFLDCGFVFVFVWVVVYCVVVGCGCGDDYV